MKHTHACCSRYCIAKHCSLLLRFTALTIAYCAVQERAATRAFGRQQGLQVQLSDIAPVAELSGAEPCRSGFHLYGPAYKQWHRDWPKQNPGTWTPEHVCCGHKPSQQCEPLLQQKDIDEFSRLESMRVAIAREETRWTEIRMQYMAAATAAGERREFGHLLGEVRVRHGRSRRSRGLDKTIGRTAQVLPICVDFDAALRHDVSRL